MLIKNIRLQYQNRLINNKFVTFFGFVTGIFLLSTASVFKPRFTRLEIRHMQSVGGLCKDGDADVSDRRFIRWIQDFLAGNEGSQERGGSALGVSHKIGGQLRGWCSSQLLSEMEGSQKKLRDCHCLWTVYPSKLLGAVCGVGVLKSGIVRKPLRIWIVVINLGNWFLSQSPSCSEPRIHQKSLLR